MSICIEMVEWGNDWVALIGFLLIEKMDGSKKEVKKLREERLILFCAQKQCQLSVAAITWPHASTITFPCAF